MIELIVVYVLWGKVAKRLYEKGYEKTIKYQLFLVVAWFGCEFLGGFIYGIAAVMTTGTMNSYVAYFMGIIGAILGASIVFLVIHNLPKLEMEGVDEMVWQPRRK